jgi:hypothetical protein
MTNTTSPTEGKGKNKLVIRILISSGFLTLVLLPYKFITWWVLLTPNEK